MAGQFLRSFGKNQEIEEPFGLHEDVRLARDVACGELRPHATRQIGGAAPPLPEHFALAVLAIEVKVTLCNESEVPLRHAPHTATGRADADASQP